MNPKNHNPKKIINSFIVVGVNELKLQKYNLLSSSEESQLFFIQNINLVMTNIIINKEYFEFKNEKWIRILNTKNFWLRFQYDSSYINPITDLKIEECDIYDKNNQYILLSKELYDQGYRPLPILSLNIKNFDARAIPQIIPEKTSFQKLDSKYVLIPYIYNCKNILKYQAKKPATLLLINRKTKFLPLKQVFYQYIKEKNSYGFSIERHKSPYAYKYLPEILDMYPKNENKNPSIALFCFPDGVRITDKFETPKCFNFVLTDELGERTYGSVIVFSQEINFGLRDRFIPNYSPDDKTFFVQKAICVLSYYPFYYNSLLFLKEIYNITEPQSKGIIPIERAICTFVDSLYIPSYDKLLRFTLNNKNIDYYCIPNYGKIWDTNDKYLETLFRVLSYENIITAWEGLLLEKKLYIICSSKNTLSHIANALINLLFPFKWIHVYVPILPEQLKLFIESPVPLIIGIFFHIEINELPQDSLILNVNENRFENYRDKIPPLPQKLNKILMTKLLKLKEQYKLDNPCYVDNYLINQDEALIYLGPDTLLFPRIDTCEIRDAFYSVFLAMFKNYEKYFSYSTKVTGIEYTFLKNNFLKDHNSLEENSFLSLFSDTVLFSQFINAFSVEENNVNSSFAFFIESIKKGKPKNNKYFLSRIIPKNVVFAQNVEISDLKGKVFNYPEFPKLNEYLFIKHEAPKVPYKSRFIYAKDEWCFSPDKIKKKDWPKYFVYLIYDIWFTFFSFVLNIYEDDQATILMDYALFLVEYLNNDLKISPTRNLFSKLIKSCARSALNPYVKQLLVIVKNINKDKSRFNSLFHNEYLNGLYFLTENVTNGITRDSLTNSTMLINTLRTSVLNEMKKTDNSVQNKLKKIIFLTYNLCENCLKKTKEAIGIYFDEILAGFILKNNQEIKSVCSNCLNYFVPKIYFLEEDQDDLNLKELNFLSPMNLIEKIDTIIKSRGEISFYKEIEWSEIYFNIIFYFELFDLPNCVLYVQNKMSKFEKIKNELKENRNRKLMSKEKEKEKKKINFFFQKFNRGGKPKPGDHVSNLSFDKFNSNSNLSTNNISDLSFTSNGKRNIFMSNEMDIWRTYQLKKLNMKTGVKFFPDETSEKNNVTQEDKNEVNSKINETRFFLKDIINYFCVNSQEKLRIFLEKYDKNENLKKNDFVNMQLKKENDKYALEQSLKNSDKFSINANLNLKINMNDIKQIDRDDNIIKNIINPKTEKQPLDNLSKYKTFNNNIINNTQNQISNIKNNTQNINANQYIINNNITKNNYNQIPNNNNYIYNHANTTRVWNNNNIINNNINNNVNVNTNVNNAIYQYPKSKYNDKILKTPPKQNYYGNVFNNNINNNQNDLNESRKKQYTVRQVNTYKSIYDN